MLPNLIQVLGGGKTNLLFNDFVAERIGFRTYIDPAPGNYFHLQKKTDKEIENSHINTLKNERELDLSFSVDPQKWLANENIKNQMREIKKTRGEISINISYCQFSSKLQTAIEEFVEEFSNFFWIFYSWDDDHLRSALQFFSAIPKRRIKKTVDSASIVLPRSITDMVYAPTPTGDENLEQFYIYIPKGKIGRLEKNKESSPIVGLCTHALASNILVLISKDKKRYVLIPIDQTLNIDNIIEQEEEWVGKDEIFYNYRRKNSGIEHQPADAIYEPGEICVDDDVQAITVTLGDNKPYCRKALPSNTRHENQALLYLRHHLKAPEDKAFSPLIFDGKKWSIYSSFEKIINRIETQVGIDFKKATPFDIWNGMAKYSNTQKSKKYFASRILACQFLINHKDKEKDQTPEKFLYNSISVCVKNNNVDTQAMVNLILENRIKFREKYRYL